MIARPVTTRRRFAPGCERALLTKPPSAALPWLTTSQSSGTRISIPPQNAKVSSTAARPSGIDAWRRSISQPPITAVAWPPLKSEVVTTVLVPPMNWSRSRAAAGSLGAAAGRSALSVIRAPISSSRAAQTVTNDARPSVTIRNATPATIQKRADMRCGAGESHLTMPTATSASGQKRKTSPPSTRPRLSSASTRPASMTARPSTTRGVTRNSGDWSSGLYAGSIVCLRP